MQNLHAIILAAGKGTRMNSDLPKVVHEILHKPMVSYVIEAVRALGCDETTLITGYKSELVKEILKDYGVSYVEQLPEQLGTGHAVQCFAKAAEKMPRRAENLLVVCGDTPLISRETLKEMVEIHKRENPAITMMTLMLTEPANYGRVLRQNGQITAIREAKDCSAEELKVKEVNLAIYLFDSKFLFENIFKLEPNNKQREYYLTDLVEMAANQGLKVVSCVEKDEKSTLGINTLEDLKTVENILKQQLNLTESAQNA